MHSNFRWQTPCSPPSTSPVAQDLAWKPQWTYRPPDSIVSFEWYPYATSHEPAYFAFIIGIKDHPVQLLDATDLRIRASYTIQDHQERFIAPHSITFSTDSTLLYCGIENAIQVFEISQPTKPSKKIQTTPNRSSQQGQKGIISSLCFKPDQTEILVAGSLNGTVGFYDLTLSDQNKLVKLVKLDQTKGVTKIKFHPQGHLLYVSSRQSYSILNVINTRRINSIDSNVSFKFKLKLKTTTTLHELKSKMITTNQKLGFDVDSFGDWVICGTRQGQLECFSAEYDKENEFSLQSFKLTNQPIGSCLFVPGQNLILTCCGTRKFQSNEFNNSDQEEEQQEQSHQINSPIENESNKVDDDVWCLHLWRIA
ncbi:hypothetical protein OIO90_000656 [Microbotryomycetes sp. JL221]|nr:hypothetical protein OIO90_000656 [Microbotryomycetes sp. JL221]